MKKFRYVFVEESNEVRAYETESKYYCTNREGEGLFVVDTSKSSRAQLIGTCDFSLRGLSPAYAKKKLRDAII